MSDFSEGQTPKESVQSGIHRLDPTQESGQLAELAAPSSVTIDATESGVVSIDAYRSYRQARQQAAPQIDGYLTMTKLELLEEMVKFQEKRSTLGHLTLQMMLEGRALFKRLAESAETRELQLLTSSYCRHLDYELKHALKSGTLATEDC